MSALKLRARARAACANPNVPEPQQRKNARKWLRTVYLLGDRWVFARPVTLAWPFLCQEPV
jgi:hypothetical protein